jgi:ATP-dependent exoDNAse (exonuclease V) alpha subunit
MIETIDVDDNIALRMEDARAIEFNASEHRHFDHGYAVTSHSSQGPTAAARVLIRADTSVNSSRVGPLVVMTRQTWCSTAPITAYS